jgi:hypothetical protein
MNWICSLLVALPLATSIAGCHSSPLLEKQSGQTASKGGQTVDTRIGKIDLQNGYPSDQSVTKLYDELDFQRAVQAYIWATPAVALDSLRLANKRDWGVDYNGVGVVNKFTSPAVIALTGNSTTIYAASFIDLERDGPVVVDSPPAAYGVVDDYWQRPVVEVGPFGPDKGKGGKFLFVPPGYMGKLPQGYFVAHSLTNRIMYLARGFVKDGDVKSAVDTLAKIRSRQPIRPRPRYLWLATRA